MTRDDEPDRTIAQFRNERGSEADLRGHWSVERGDYNPQERDRGAFSAEFQRHLETCGVCRRFEAEVTS